MCPYLTAGAGAWRSAHAAREHRCGALRPPAPLAASKQRDLCLVPAHETCATYVAARALEAEGQPAEDDDGGLRLWPATRSTPVVLEPASRITAVIPASLRSGGQPALIGLMVVAFVVLAVARSATEPGAGPATMSPATAVVAASASPTATTASATATPSSAPATASPEPTTEVTPSPATPSPAPTRTPRPTPSPSPTGSQQYTVKPGDTLSAIAARFGTTVKALKKLNGIVDASLIRVGQVLMIP